MKKRIFAICKNEGLSEEAIKAIVQVYDTEMKWVRSRKKQREALYEKYGITFCSLSSFQDEEGNEFEVGDANEDVVSEALMHASDIALIHECLDELNQEEKEFLICWAEGKRGIDARMAEHLGISKDQFRWKKKVLLKKLRQKFMQKINEENTTKE